MSSPRAPPPDFPDPLTALALSSTSLPDYFSALAAPSLYQLDSTPSTRARLVVALYSFALNPDPNNADVRALFWPNETGSEGEAGPGEVNDLWTLSGAQQAAAASTSGGAGGGGEYGPSRRGKPCGHVFKPGESVYRCRDCAVDPTCVLCARCFHSSSHSREGHDVTVSTHAGVGAGCCDCGDEEAWKEGRQRDCRYHGVEPSAADANETSMDADSGSKGKTRAPEQEQADPSSPASLAGRERVRAHLRAALDWAIAVLARSQALTGTQLGAPLPRTAEELFRRWGEIERASSSASSSSSAFAPSSAGAAASVAVPAALEHFVADGAGDGEREARMRLVGEVQRAVMRARAAQVEAGARAGAGAAPRETADFADQIRAHHRELGLLRDEGDGAAPPAAAAGGAEDELLADWRENLAAGPAAAAEEEADADDLTLADLTNPALLTAQEELLRALPAGSPERRAAAVAALEARFIDAARRAELPEVAEAFQRRRAQRAAGEVRAPAPAAGAGLEAQIGEVERQMLRSAAAAHLAAREGAAPPLLGAGAEEAEQALEAAAEAAAEPEVQEAILPGAYPASASSSAAAPPPASSSSSAASRPPPPPPEAPQGPFAVLLYNDEKHSFTQVIDQVSRAVGCSRHAASAVAQRVDTVGRDGVLVSPDAGECLSAARKIAEIELAVSVRRAEEAFEEQVAHFVVGRFARDLGKASFGGEPGGLADLVAEVWLERGEGGGGGGGKGRSRWMRLAAVEAGLWKSLRKEVQEGAVGLMGVSVEVRAEVGRQFAEVYPTLLETYLLNDREPEHSLLFFGVQVFTVPSLSTSLISSANFHTQLLVLLYSFFTHQLSRTKRRLIFPPSFEPHLARVDLLRNPFLKQRRYFQPFSDLSHLLSSPSAQRALLRSPSPSRLIDTLAAFLTPFSGMNPQSRAIGAHVEYENDAWVTAFNLSIQVARFVRTVGEAFRQATPVELAEALRALLGKMDETARVVAARRRVEAELAAASGDAAAPPMEGEMELHNVILEGGGGATEGGRARRYPVVDFRVSTRPVSYHHPLGWLWAEVAKYSTAYAREGGEEVARFGRDGMETVGVRSLGEMLGAMEAPERFLKAMEEPVRTVALVAQVRSGVWVRNGFGIRAQNLHYKDYTLRENTYDQDLFFLQTALVTLDPALVVASLLDRFELVEWLTQSGGAEDGSFPHPSYEPEQAIAMVDELLNLLLTLTTDPTYVVPLSPTAALRRELIHHLALGPTVYSDLLRHLSERFSDDPNIDRVLAQVARFKPPTGSTDQGTYTLREEHLGEVDPYFSRYSRNQREEADKVVRTWMKRTGNGERPRASKLKDEPVIVPAKLAVDETTSGPFVSLPAALADRPLLLIVYYALSAATTRGDKLFSEQVVDAALQLALVSFIEQPDTFVAFAVEPVVPPQADEAVTPSSLVDVLLRLEEDDRLAAVASKVAWILDRLADAHGEDALPGRTGAIDEEEGKKAAEAAQAELEAKRAAAKKRQEAIMRQFQQAQSAFLQNVEDDDEDEDELDGEGEATMRDGEEAAPPRPKTNFGSCIVCQDELEEAEPFGVLALVQGSNLVRLTPTGEGNQPFQDEILSLPASLDRDASQIRPFGTASQKLPVGGYADSSDGIARGFPQSQKGGIHASSCGHMMHLACFERYCRSLEQRHQQQPTRNHPENLERREFTCPLCKSLGNVLLPAEVDSPAFLPFSGDFDRRTLDEWAKPDADPLDDRDGDYSLKEFEDSFHHRVDKLTLLNDLDHSSSFKPWRATMALPMLLPQHFSEAEGRMTARLLQVIAALQTEVGGTSANLATLSKDVVGYTVSTLEIASRGTAEPAWQLSDPNVKLLQSLVNVMQDLAALMTQNVESARIAALSVKQRLGGFFAQGTKFADVEFTLFDPLGAVIEAGVCMPSAFYHVAAVAFYTALAQAYLGVFRLFHQSTSLSSWRGDEHSPEAAEYLELEAVRAFFPPESSPALFDPERVEFRLTVGKHLHAQMLVFLRRVALVARVVLGEPSDEATDAFMDDEDRSEFARLLDFLRIPSPKEIFSPDSTNPAVRTLQAHLRTCHDSVKATVLCYAPVQSSAAAILPSAIERLLNSSVPDLEHPTIYELLGLPHQLDTLVQAGVERTCHSCGTVPSMPALCLFCGEMVCAQSFCCMVGEDEASHGECNEHMWTCGGSVGMYYLLKRNTILYLHADKGTFATPPYLDSHGEVDAENRRTRSQFPQYLHRGRYDEMRKLWLSGTIPTFVARKLEAVTDHGGWTTF
ncbi:hypothetical protein JCM8097_001527 [Rhodosporidiobolus ruineniae]